MTVLDEEIRGYIIAEDCVCRDCASQADIYYITSDELVLEHMLGSCMRFFCGSCKKEIKPN